MKIGMGLIILWTLCAFAQQNSATAPQQFYGTYAQLRPAQKKLIDDWYAEYNEMMHTHDDPADYDQLSLSTRTTFEAVTHALLTTKMTSKTGQAEGDALDLVQSIETINGKVPKARGDLQFRMYVVLKPDALQNLKDSREFFRDRDNTIYHHGYPMNYRQDGGVPSIQVSIAKDGRHADIDVDYRSSKFPSAILNGHLTAANSDVRAGNNTQRHLQRWDGLTDWWHNLFGLADSEEETPADAAAASGEVPPVPRKAPDKLEDAVADYLGSWLVEQKPELAAAYLSHRSFACLEEYGPQAGKEINAGVAPYLAARDMAATNRLMGKPASLQEAVKPSPLSDASLKPIKQNYGTTFALYQVSDGVAADFECDPERAFEDYDRSRIAGTNSKYGRYFASVFQLTPSHEKGDTITLLWTKEGKYWKIVSWDVEPEDGKSDAGPDMRRTASVAATPPLRATGDPDFLHAANQFLHSWLISDDFAQAALYFSPRCYPCVTPYLSVDEQAPQTPEEYAARIRKGLTIVGKDVGPARHLPDVIEPVVPDHDDLKLVSHPGQDAYTVVAVPDYLAESFSCEKWSTKQPYQATADDPQAKTYGKYYATLFALRTPGNHPASLTFLWSKVDGQWKIVSYELAAP